MNPLWPYVAAVLSAGGLVVAALEVLKRRRDHRLGPHLRQHLQDWYDKDPVIKAANLPEVKPLKATR